MPLQSTRRPARTQLWLASRRSLVLLVVVAAVASACADVSPTAPSFDDLAVGRRKTEFRCVAPDSSTVTPVPEGGDCPAGFDLIPWY